MNLLHLITASRDMRIPESDEEENHGEGRPHPSVVANAAVGVAAGATEMDSIPSELFCLAKSITCASESEWERERERERERE